MAEFDQYALEYEAALAQGLSVSGEDKDFFARGRLLWLAERLKELGERPQAVLDFGCGTASSAAYYFTLLGAESLLGVDESPKSIEVAARGGAQAGARFLATGQYEPDGRFDLVFCNGVFHHIPPPARAAALTYIRRALRPGGLFAFWENNPWNPGTRYVMSRCPFDRDAMTLTPPAARRLLRQGGFDPLRTDFLFIFPRPLQGLRPLEPLVSRLPFGAQYQVLCRKRGD